MNTVISDENTNLDDDFELESEQSLTPEKPSTAPEPGRPKKNSIDEIIVSHPVEIKSRDELDQALERHHEWLESVLNPVKKIGLGRANFASNDFAGWDLTGVNLSGATLTGVNFRGACLEKANLSACNLEGADFSGAVLKGLKLRRARVKGAIFDEEALEGMDLKGTDISGVRKNKIEAIETQSAVEAETAMDLESSNVETESESLVPSEENLGQLFAEAE